jgi:hypothetical protein
MTLLHRVFAPGGITARFEPVVDVSCNPVGCAYLEGLVRGPAGTNLERADVLFSYIRRKRESARMESACSMMSEVQNVVRMNGIGDKGLGIRY